MNKVFFEDDNLKLPSIKIIEMATGIKYYQVRKKLTTLYESIFNDQDQLILGFNKIEYHFFVRGNHTACDFRI